MSQPSSQAEDSKSSAIWEATQKFFFLVFCIIIIFIFIFLVYFSAFIFDAFP